MLRIQRVALKGDVQGDGQVRVLTECVERISEDNNTWVRDANGNATLTATGEREANDIVRGCTRLNSAWFKVRLGSKGG